jgi:hypothetical protein
MYDDVVLRHGGELFGFGALVLPLLQWPVIVVVFAVIGGVARAGRRTAGAQQLYGL